MSKDRIGQLRQFRDKAREHEIGTKATAAWDAAQRTGDSALNRAKEWIESRPGYNAEVGRHGKRAAQSGAVTAGVYLLAGLIPFSTPLIVAGAGYTAYKGYKALKSVR